MGWKLGASVAVLAALGVSGTATAGQKCARSTEVTAIQVAAVQQELMVAALTCHDVVNFNAFQTSYGDELRRSDWRLRHMFRRLFGSRGDSQYHAFKTRLANNSSIRSIHDNAAYCKEAQLVFAAALTPKKPALSEFVSGVAVQDDSPVDRCDIRVATGFAGARAVPNVVPKPNPLRVAALTPAAPVAVTPVAKAPAAAADQQASAPAAAPLQKDAATAPVPAKPASAADVEPGSSTQQARATPAASDKDKKSSGWLSSIFN